MTFNKLNTAYALKKLISQNKNDKCGNVELRHSDTE